MVKLKEDDKMSTLFAVVCTDLHGGLGLFSTPKEAMAFAKKASAQSSCDFVPVAIGIVNGKMEVEEENLAPYRPGVYL